MKNSIFIFLLVVSFNAINFAGAEPNFSSLEDFLKLIKENGVFDFLQELSILYKDAVANTACHLLYETDYCDQVIRIYARGSPFYLVSYGEYEHLLKKIKEDEEFIKSIITKHFDPSNNSREKNNFVFGLIKIYFQKFL